ncbi:hypothetical protein [Accumulibacter sp.]|uniref:hypothetical protein n=1 Tax=Candidatus Accumulibacter TaxID=327159 RepID=UPI001900B7F8|nr:hypothetical protein [Accumulibacter sp.]MBN8499399.1 hypothetical protein [Accumulibacter sp.]MBO3713494.1 hypothetical protein [Accumulibacter sp.]
MGMVVASLAACSKVDEAALLKAELPLMWVRMAGPSPGKGLVDYPSDGPADIPKAYAMILLAAVDAQRAGRGFPEAGTVSGLWLLDHADENRNGITGWGVPVAWDAYGDGSENPASTEYTIATAIAVHALLDWAGEPGTAPRDRIMEVVLAASQPYFDASMRTPAGLLPYSLSPPDRRYDTFNPAAYMAGQMQRLSRLVNDPGQAELLRQAADQTMQALLDHRKVNPATGSWYWNYSVQEDSSNDLPHASYVVDGIRTYIRHGGRLAAAFDREKVLAHLDEFLGEKTPDIRAWPRLRPDVTLAARSYDIGMALHVACTEPAMAGLRTRLIAATPAYKDPDGQYLKYPAASKERNFVVREYETYLLRGFETCLAHPVGGAK